VQEPLMKCEERKVQAQEPLLRWKLALAKPLLIAAESFGGPSTQFALNTFHFILLPPRKGEELK